MTERQWNKITVVGCGLIGASFALAVRQAGVCAVLAGWDTSPSVLDEAIRRGVIDEVDQALSEGNISSADLIYLAMPVEGILRFLCERGEQLKPGAVVTDAGSTKVEVCRAARLFLPKDRQFVGGHPVAGSHLQGLAHARADLFTGAPYVLVTEEDEDENEALTAFSRTLDALGTRVMRMTAAEHDRAMAFVSHLPQLVSSSLAAVIENHSESSLLHDLAGTGFQDMTRLAASPWTVWRDILATNPTQITGALDLLIEKLSIMRDELRRSQKHDGDQLKITKNLFA